MQIYNSHKHQVTGEHKGEEIKAGKWLSLQGLNDYYNFKNTNCISHLHYRYYLGIYAVQNTD